MSYINIGKVTEELNELAGDKVAKGHEVIEFQAPTVDNGYTWYRKYADGWVEQGVGPRDLTSAVYTFTFPIPMQTSNYFVLTGLNDSLNTTTMTIKVTGRTTTSLQCRNTYQTSGSTINGWVEVKGMYA